MPTGRGTGTIGVVGGWNGNRAGTARTERRFNLLHSEPVQYAANSCLEAGDWKTTRHGLAFGDWLGKFLIYFDILR